MVFMKSRIIAATRIFRWTISKMKRRHFEEYQTLYIGKSYRFMRDSQSRYVQNIYSFTSEQLGSGATGSIRAVINR